MDDVTAEDIINHPLFLSAHPDYVAPTVSDRAPASGSAQGAVFTRRPNSDSNGNRPRLSDEEVSIRTGLMVDSRYGDAAVQLASEDYRQRIAPDRTPAVILAQNEPEQAPSSSPSTPSGATPA